MSASQARREGSPVVYGNGVAGEALSFVSRPGGEHTQTG
jgi:hypothetical protein